MEISGENFVKAEAEATLVQAKMLGGVASRRNIDLSLLSVDDLPRHVFRVTKLILATEQQRQDHRKWFDSIQEATENPIDGTILRSCRFFKPLLRSHFLLEGFCQRHFFGVELIDTNAPSTSTPTQTRDFNAILQEYLLPEWIQACSDAEKSKNMLWQMLMAL